MDKTKRKHYRDDFKKYSAADFNFHLNIAKASKNQVFVKVIHSIRDIYYKYLDTLYTRRVYLATHFKERQLTRLGVAFFRFLKRIYEGYN
ncbi:FCD domain-containing protein [Neobacillus pocheonensis]|uniref:FCD domain-containing protein n=1 Tax=Neobacillus pocheonensis TaxID=363869 RepID=A0ABT0W9D4_9BACI|nr:FCD domain-containing protein [Neobacillus pocheonensis]